MMRDRILTFEENLWKKYLEPFRLLTCYDHVWAQGGRGC